MEILGREVETKVIVGIAVIGIMVFLGFGALLLYSGFFKTGYESELFSLLPSNGMTGATYIELNSEGMRELSELRVFGGDASRVDSAAFASAKYGDGSSAFVAFIKTGMTPDEAVGAYAGAMGYGDSEKLTAGNNVVTALYQKSDSGHANPLCVWKRADGLGILGVSRNVDDSYCQFTSDISCREQKFEEGLLWVKIKSNIDDKLVVTEAACSGASFSSKNLRYVPIPDVKVTSDKEVWLEGIPCYDAGNNVVMGGSFRGKLFIRYYTESEGSGSPKLVSGNVAARSATQTGAGARCLDVMEKSYGSSKAMSLLSGADKLIGTVQTTGVILGSAKFGNELGSAYAVGYRNEEAHYIVVLGNDSLVTSVSGVGASEGLRCVRGNDSTADLVPKDGKLGCRRDFEYGDAKGITYFRKTQDGTGAVVLSLPKIRTGTADMYATNVAFEIDLKGPDVKWQNETSGSVKVFSLDSECMMQKNDTKACEAPLEGARVELYDSPGGGGAMGKLIEAKETDFSGTASFARVPLSGGVAVIAKRGYQEEKTHKLVAEGFLSEQGNFTITVGMVPAGALSPQLEAYILESNITEVSTGLIDARGTFPSLSAYGLSLVNSSGSVQSVVVVGRGTVAEEVAAASRIAEILASREYECGLTINKGSYSAEPFNVASTPIIALDSAGLSGTLIAVGNPDTNAILRGAIGLSRDSSNDSFVTEKGNVIAIVGSGSGAMKAARDFVRSLKTNVSGCGGGLRYGNTTIINSEGRPAVHVVIGKQASTAEAIAGAYIATKLASLSAMCVHAETDTTGCVPRGSANPDNLVVTDDSVPTGYSVISLGGTAPNSFTNQNCEECRDLREGKAIIRRVENETFISGYRMGDTLSAASEFISAIGNPVPSFQKEPYYAIKVASFTARESGHNEIGLSFYDDSNEIQTGKALPGEFYILRGGRIAKIEKISAISVGSSSVTFLLDGERLTVGMGRFLCHTGALEDSLTYCTKERENTTLSISAQPTPALFMGKFYVFADYTAGGGDVLGANCTYCLTGPAVLCRNLVYKAPRDNRYGDEVVLDKIPMGIYALRVNCTAEGYKNAAGNMTVNISRILLPDLVVDSVRVNYIMNTKITVTVGIKNTGRMNFNASEDTPLVTCLWDGYGRNLFSHVSYNASMKPGGTFEFTQSFLLSSVEGNNTILARVDCNNVFPEESETNNEKQISFGRYG